MTGRFNPLVILQGHFKTFRDPDTRVLYWPDMAFFLLLPLLVALLLLLSGVQLSEGFVEILTTSMSIFIGLLFNLLLLVYSIVRDAGAGARREASAPEASELRTLRRRFLQEIFANISFSILVAIVVVVVVLGASVLSAKATPWANEALSAVVYYLLGLFLLTLFMILRRVHILLAREFTG